jgi:predicted alternative tryptophan synthase beta-subunit
VDLAGEYPDVLIGCVGGGSNVLGEKLRQGRKTRIVVPEVRRVAAPV